MCACKVIEQKKMKEEREREKKTKLNESNECICECQLKITHVNAAKHALDAVMWCGNSQAKWVLIDFGTMGI